MIHIGKYILALTLFSPAFSYDFFLDDSLENVDFMKVFKEKCAFKCKNGETPRENKSHKPKPQGCGQLGRKFDYMRKLKGLQSCCEKHSTCYETCNESRSACDSQFYQCLKDLCAKKSEKENKNVCDQIAMLMYTSTNALGCDVYKKGQKKACKCGQNKPRLSEEL